MEEPLELATEEYSDRGARVVAVFAVLATLAAAVAGYLQSEAGKAADEAVLQAQQLSSAAVIEGDRSSEQSFVQLDLFLRRQLDLRSAALARELDRFTPLPDEQLQLEERTSFELAEIAARRAAAIGAAEASGVAPIEPDGPQGPDLDVAFPSRFLIENGEQAIELLGESDASTEYGQQRSDEVSAYIAQIAIFSVAVYLFGFSLTPHGRSHRTLFASTAAVLTAGGIVWGAATVLASPEPADAAAAQAYARAETALAVEDFGDAVGAYDEAIAERPDFALAYKHRALARFLADSPQVREALSVNLTSPEALTAAIDDFERARELGLEDSTVLGALGFAGVSLGIQEHDDDRIADGIELGERASELAPGKPAVEEGVGYLALGDRAKAFELFELAAKQIPYADVEAQERRHSGLVLDEIAGAMTTLELLAAEYPELADDVVEAKELLVDGVQDAGGRGFTGAEAAGEDAPAEPAPPVEKLEPFVWAGGLEVSVPADQLRPKTDRTWIQWYRRDPGLGWFAMPYAARGGAGYWVDTGSSWTSTGYYLRDNLQPFCLPPAEYRVELYVNGQLAASEEVESKVTPLEPAVDRVLGYRICRPADWRPLPSARLGLINGFVNSSGNQGVYVVRLGDTSGLGGTVTEAGGAEAALDAVLDRLGDYMPSGLQPDGTVDVAFIGETDEIVRDYVYPGGSLRAGASRQGDGSYFVGLAFGPDAARAQTEDLFLAISEGA